MCFFLTAFKEKEATATLSCSKTGFNPLWMVWTSEARAELDEEEQSVEGGEGAAVQGVMGLPAIWGFSRLSSVLEGSLEDDSSSSAS